MTKQVINVGTVADDGTGDTIRTGGQKINSMFEEVYLNLGNTSNITVNTQTIVSNTYLQANYTTNTVVRLVQSELYTTNTVLRSLISANASSILTTVADLTQDRMQVANVNSLVDDRLQVANASVLYVTKAGALTTNNAVITYINSEIGSSNTNIRNYTDTTYATKATVLASNNALKNLITNRMQVANVNNLALDRMQVANVNSLVLDRMQVSNAESIGLSSVTFYDANDTIVFTRPDSNQLKVKLVGVATNSYAIISGDVGSTTADNDKDTLTISGNNGIKTIVTGDSLTIHQANNYTAIATLKVTANGTSGYLFNSHYPEVLGNNPTLYAISGTTLAFDLSDVTSSHPFQIQDSGGTNYSNNLIHVTTTGTTTFGTNAQGKYGGILYWQIPYNVSGNYAYKCQNHAGMTGTITIKDISAI